jgi:hypothetical protein
MALSIVPNHPIRTLLDDVIHAQQHAAQLRQKAERAEQVAEIKLGALLLEVAATLEAQ